MTEARTQTRREGKKGAKNWLLNMGSSMSQWGLTPHIPSDLEESGHGKDGRCFRAVDFISDGSPKLVAIDEEVHD
jgi:hypothetical protein